ncbi:MAG: family 10 glycosylhydrolase [Bacilli bacterium]|nr:family 10 glycosylhydrolase [Bacilli bacterium]
MKKLIVVVMIFVVITFFIIGKKQELKDEPVVNNTTDEYRAIFISYLELETYIKGVSNDVSKNNIIEILDNMKNNNFNIAILHVRPFSDAIYESKIYPYSSYVSTSEGGNPGYDILKFFIKEAHARNIEVHAWINPYRIRNTTNIEDIKENSPAYRYLNTNHVKVIDNKGIFYNPASDEIRELIIKGVEEVVTNYDIDGIHFDDYFYPDDTIDLDNYKEYVDSGGTLTLSDYRLNNISLLIKGVYNSIKKIKPNVLFGISPEGNINNNYESNFIDTKKILSEEGYVDYIMPQIYYGFFNEVMPFIDTVNMWNSLIKVPNIKLIPALAFYKTGKIDDYAKGGKEEWINDNDIIMKQVLLSKNLSNYGGFSLFRYDYIFNSNYQNNNTLKEKENLFSIIK